MKTGLESLDTGAPEITYSGNEGPKSPQQIQQMQMAQLEDEYDKYVDEMLEQGLEPMSMRQFLEQIAAEAQMSSNEEGIGGMMEDPRAMAADGGIMRIGFQGGGRDMSTVSSGSFKARDYSPKEKRDQQKTADLNQRIRESERGQQQTVNTQAAINKAQAQAQKAKDKKEAEEKAAKEKEAKETAQTRSFFERIAEARTNIAKMTLAKSLNKKLGLGFDPTDEDFLEQIERAGEDTFGIRSKNDLVDYDMSSYGLTGQDLARGKKQFEVMGQDNISQRDFENVYRPYNQMFVNGEFTPGPILPAGGGGGGGGGQQIQQPATPPGTPPPATPPGIPTDPVTGQYSNKYFIPGASNFYSNLPSTMFNPTTNMLTLAADGGRMGYAGGGIADLRQGYFLGKLVKGITKPFKSVFKGFKKIAKSPLGKMALMYFGGNLLQGNALFGNPLSGVTNKLGSMFTSNGTKANLSGFSKLGEGFKSIAKTAFKPENAFSTIAGISGLAGLYTNYVNNKREDESMADYQRRLEIERGNFAPIPTNFVQFANGGIADDEDESIRSKALGALYQKLAMGGSAGLPPVTMQTEGQDTQSFGDDESTGMANATPTMQNQMPMRPPMMDPRMQQQMMMQRGNPMMNRGMMSMQQPPRIMAQEGGRIGYADAGSVMKDPDEVVAGMDNELNPGIKDQLLKRIDRDMGVDLIDKIQSLKYGKDFLGFDSLGYPETSKNDPMSMEQTIQYLENLFDQHIDEGNDPRKGGYFHDLGVYSKDDIRRRVELGFDLAKGPETQTGIMKAAYGGRIPAQEGGMMDMDRKTILKGIADGVFTFDDLTKYARDKAPKKKNVDPIRQAILKGVADGLFTFDDLTKYDGQGVLPLEEITKPIAEPFYPDRFKDLKPIAEPFYPDRFKNLKPELMAQGGRIEAQEGGMMDMGGMEKDYRNEGGFVPIGGQERADDVPARLSKNEFVFTADAVRNAGGGDIDKGAEIMENMMENLEQGGKVSKASQGLSGAREMFATSQRLEEVL
jgi:hypothetical protein